MSQPDEPRPDNDADAAVPRRSFLASAAAVTAGFTIVPRHVLGGQGTPAPSMRRLASALSPMARMAAGGGPMKTSPASPQASAKSARSDRKP